MSQFIVSARKYRPQTFDTVVGQQSITNTLKAAIQNNHLAQAFLFCGPRGVGKTSCARILARTINCENLNPDFTTCGTCAPCASFEEGHSLNIYELDAASNNGVEQIRDLTLQVNIAPQVGSKKVYIIDEVHMLSSAAFNAFLKTLEEPPSYAIFILATTEKHKILPTIISRCQVFDFKRIGIKDIVGHLASIGQNQGIQTEEQALMAIAEKADGGMRDALSIFDQLVSYSGERLTYQDVIQNLNILDHRTYFELVDILLKGDDPAALLLFDKVISQGFDGHHFVTGLGKHFRDLLVVKDERSIKLLETSEELKTRYVQQAQQADAGFIFNALERLAHCDVQYRSSKQPRLLVELTLLRCSSRMHKNGIGQAKAETSTSAAKVEEPEPARKGTQETSSSAQTVSQNNLTAPPPSPSASSPISEAPVATPPPNKSPQPELKAPVEPPQPAISPARAAQAPNLPEQDESNAAQGAHYAGKQNPAPIPEPKPSPIAEPQSGPSAVLQPTEPQQTGGLESPQKEAPPAASPVRKRMASALSISDFMKEEEKTAKQVVQEIVGNQPIVPVKQEDLNHAWKEFALARKSEGKNSLCATMLFNEPVLAGNHITFHIVNEVQELALREIRQDLLVELRQKLGAPALEMELAKQEVGEIRPRHTAKQRFAILAEKNPGLHDLKDKLKLDV